MTMINNEEALTLLFVDHVQIVMVGGIMSTLKHF